MEKWVTEDRKAIKDQMVNTEKREIKEQRVIEGLTESTEKWVKPENKES